MKLKFLGLVGFLSFFVLSLQTQEQFVRKVTISPNVVQRARKPRLCSIVGTVPTAMTVVKTTE
jgi:hypothetical protein